MEWRREKTERTTTNTKTTLSSSLDSNKDVKISRNYSRTKEISSVQCNADAGLMVDFEKSVESGESFNYTSSVPNAPESVPAQQINDYLSKIQRGGFIQSFGCMIAIEQPSFHIICYSENCFEFLELDHLLESERCKGLIGIDARTLFSPSSGVSFERAIAPRETSVFNPFCVHTRTTQKPLYAIMHQTDVGIVIDLEPAGHDDTSLALGGVEQSQKQAVRAISRLQSLPEGDVQSLCDTVVEDVQKLTGYDRVMVYKFHEDNHGEVVSECKRSDLDPYLGLHYPATDIPQAARFLFKQNRVRMIHNCQAEPVRVIQREELMKPICLVNSTLRSPHECHKQYMANMGSIASLVLAITITESNSTKLWGLVSCHHTSPRFISFPRRRACDFLMQGFRLGLQMELQKASQLDEKKVLQWQTLLCDLLLRDGPLGMVTQSPTIMELVKCDGAALYHDGKCWLLGVTPTEQQVKDIVNWLLSEHGDFTGLTTESLVEACYSGASSLGDAVCGLATARIAPEDFLFWFRSHTAKEIKWGGAMHHPEVKDGSGPMHPRSSFKAFLEVNKQRSLPWEIAEINAIHSLQVMLRDAYRDIEKSSSVVLSCGQGSDSKATEFEKLNSVASEMVRLIETASAPIFGIDSNGLVNGWNAKIAELTGLQASEAIGKSLRCEILHEDSCDVAENLIFRALQGKEDKNIELKVRKFGMQHQVLGLYIVVNTCTSRDHRNNVIGVCFVGQDVTSEKAMSDKFVRLQGDYKAIVQSPNPFLPPIFGSDAMACCSEWNTAMENLTGWKRQETIGKLLPGYIFGGLCKIEDGDTLVKLEILLYQVITGHDSQKLQFKFFNRKGEGLEVVMMANKRSDEAGNIIGCFCFLQNVVSNRQEDDGDCLTRLKELACIQHRIINPLNGLQFIHELLRNASVSDEQKQLLETIDACERQLFLIMEDTHLGREEKSLEPTGECFQLRDIMDAIVCQAMTLVRRKNLKLVHEIPDKIKMLYFFGHQVKLQLVLSDFLCTMVNYAPAENGWVEINVSSPAPNTRQNGNEAVNLHIRMTHPGEGCPPRLTQEMFGDEKQCETQEGLSLNLCHKLLKLMKGSAGYVREQDTCHLIVDIKLETRTSSSSNTAKTRTILQ